MSETALVVSEDQQITDVFKKLESFPKLRKWLELFLDKRSPATYGNKTQSALQAYNLDPITQYYVAASIGYQNFKKLQIVAQAYYDAEGMSAAKVLNLIAAHAVAGKPKALEMLAIITDVYNPKAQIVINNTQNNQTNNINATVRADDPRIDQLNRDFQEFIEAKYKKVNPQPVITETSG